MLLRKKPKGNGSLAQILKQMMALQLILVTGIFLILTALTVMQAERESTSIMNNFLHVYAEQIESRLGTIDDNMNQIIQEELILGQMQSSNHGESLRAAVEMKTMLKDVMTYSSGADCYAVYEGTNDLYLSYWNSRGDYNQKTEAENFARDLYQTGDVWVGWKFFSLAGRPFAVKVYRWNTRMVIAWISTRSLMEILPDVEEQGYQLCIADDSQLVQASSGTMLAEAEDPETIRDINRFGLLSADTSLRSGQIYLWAFQDRMDILRQVQWTSFVLLATILGLLLLDLIFAKKVNEKLILPLENMTQLMKSMSDGEYEKRVEVEQAVEEYAVLGNTFNHLMDEIFNLKISEYEKKVHLAEAEEKYIRLQIKPHFFLNALNTILGLSRKGRNHEIETYIEALNKNIRYMFSSGLHTVLCRDEISHVENYFAMQDLKYPGMVFYYIDMPEETEEWPIPQMIVHTIVENEYKYAVADGNLLSVYINISLIEHEGEEMLCIEIEDDGPGYPEAVLSYMKGEAERESSDGRRVGLWSLKRLMELMYEREDLMEVENVVPNGAKCRFFIPREPKHEKERHEKKNAGIR